MFWRANKRFKDGKEHRWSVVENRHVAGGRSVQKTLLYLGEINDSDRAGWNRAIEAVDERDQTHQIHLFPEDRTPDPRLEHPTLKLRLDHIELARPRQWGGCWLAMELWNRLDLDAFWQPLLPDSQKRHAMAQGTQNPRRLSLVRARQRVETPPLPVRPQRHGRPVRRRLPPHRQRHPLPPPRPAVRSSRGPLHPPQGALGRTLQRPPRRDLTSTYFEVDANGPVTEAGHLKTSGCSRDKRPDCVQIVIALIITPDGLPIGYEVMRGNTSYKTTLAGMLEKITARYGKERRTWITDHVIPTEEDLGKMRRADPSVRYLVGTPKGRLTKLEKDLATKDWRQVKDDIHVKLLHRDGELYVLARSLPRPKSAIQSLWWRPFEKINAISTIRTRKTH